MIRRVTLRMRVSARLALPLLGHIIIHEEHTKLNSLILLLNFTAIYFSTICYHCLLNVLIFV